MNRKFVAAFISASVVIYFGAPVNSSPISATVAATDAPVGCGPEEREAQANNASDRFTPPSPGESPSTTIPDGAYVDTPPDDEVTKAFEEQRHSTTVEGSRVTPIPLDLPTGSPRPGGSPYEESRARAASADESTKQSWEQVLTWYTRGCDDSEDTQRSIARQGYSTHHSNHIRHPTQNDGIYAFEYYAWIGSPRSGETNRCDSLVSTSLCVWFIAGEITTTGDCGWHFGPIRGDWAGANYGTNFGYYCPGLPNGVEHTNTGIVPLGQWVRFRVWRMSQGSNWSEWGIWRDESYLGSVLLDGTSAWSTGNWTEIIEDEPCYTDFERVYFNAPRFWHVSLGANLQPAWGQVNYEENCSNSSWEKADGNQGSSFVKNERSVSRVLPDEAFAWK